MFHKVVQRHVQNAVKSSARTSLDTFCWVSLWKNFDYSKDVFPNINCTQATEIDLHGHSNSSERGTKRVLRVNLSQIRSAVPEIYFIHKRKVTDSAKNRTLRRSLRAVKIGQHLAKLWARARVSFWLAAANCPFSNHRVNAFNDAAPFCRTIVLKTAILYVDVFVLRVQ